MPRPPRLSNPGRAANDSVTVNGRACNRCEQWKPWAEFGLRAAGRGGRTARCRTCIASTRPPRSPRERVQGRVYDKTRHRRDKWLRRAYGVSIEQWDAMLIEQAGRCGVCATPMRKPTLDHDHRTGVVRRLLCYRCNVALGLVDDDTAWLQALISYVEEYRR